MLRHGETGALLELLDHWPIGDGWRARDFFRRYIELDPSFVPENVWVAEQEGRLVSCVQVFPRTLRGRFGPVRCGGIGSVFTLPAHRRRGLASQLLERAAVAMRERGMEVSLLLATLTRWYGSFGWRVWSDHKLELAARPSRRRPSMGGRPFEPTRDSEAVATLARDYSHTLFGTVARGEADWQSTWTLGGNPEERVSVADDGREIVAYLRATDLEGRRQLTEWGCNGRGVAALADLIDAELTAAGSARVLAPAIPDEPLYEYLKARAIGVASVRSAAWMLRSLNTGSLRARRSEAGASGEAETDASNPPGDGLEEWFPRDRFAFWPADRF